MVIDGKRYLWTHGELCQDVTIRVLSDEPLEDLGHRFVKGMVVHTGRDPVSNIRICSAGACDYVARNSLFTKGQSAGFALDVPSLDEAELVVECLVLRAM